jgi:MFS family permease
VRAAPLTLAAVAVLRPEPSEEDPPDTGDLLADPEHHATADLYPEAPNDRPGWHVRLFGSHEFFHLWLAQVVSSTGDWLGFSAIILLASRVGESGGAGAISLVMAARIIPGFFFAPLAGVLVDRWDRKRVMVGCDLGRAAVIATLPFVDSLAGLVLASLVLEIFTLLWTPAKDATVPGLVPQDHLTTANSLSLAAAYGTFPFAALLFALLAGVSQVLSDIDALSFLRLDQMSLAFYVDVVTFLFAALMVRSLTFPPRERAPRDRTGRRVDLGATFRELKEGWHYIFINPTVRAVNVGLATGLIGGGMLIPLGAVFSTEVLDAGAAGYGLFTTALGFGVATGVLLVSTLQRRLPKAAVFTGSLFAAGISLFFAASTSSLGPAAVFVFLMGMSVGPVYVLGFVLLQEETDDELRGRVFASLSTLVRLCVLVSMIAGPLVAAALGGLAESLTGGTLEVGALTIAIPGVRLALWLGALIIIVAGFLTRQSVRSGARDHAARESDHPSRGDRGPRDPGGPPS